MFQIDHIKVGILKKYLTVPQGISLYYVYEWPVGKKAFPDLSRDSGDRRRPKEVPLGKVPLVLKLLFHTEWNRSLLIS